MTSDTTPRVLAYVRRQLEVCGLAPTRAEIAQALGLSTSAADYHLKKLHASGEILWTKDTSRNMKLKDA